MKRPHLPTPRSELLAPADAKSGGASAWIGKKFGQYTLVKELGRGATAIVYLADDEKENRQVALKIIVFGDGTTKASRRLKRLFKGEATIGMQLQHPNIVRIYDAQIFDEMAYIAMEYVKGEQLTRYTTFDKLLPANRVAGIIFKTAMALDYAARRGVVHRDIKPDNIMIMEGDEVKITDFGLALDVRKKGETDSTNITGVGSPAYMSPEQIKDYPLNHQSDIYSLGVVMFEMLTGRRPYRAGNYASLVYKIINTDAPNVSALNPGVPDSLDSIVKKSLEKDLYTRYRTGTQLAQDISGAKLAVMEDEIEKFNLRFRVLRGLGALVEFDNEELWEVLRITTWRVFNEGVLLMKEGDPGDRFGIIIEGTCEVSKEGKLIASLGPSEVLGEMAYLAKRDKYRSATVVAATDVVFLEVNPSAFTLSSDEVKDHFNELLINTLSKRLKSANERFAQMAPEARQGKEQELGSSFSLVEKGRELEIQDFEKDALDFNT